MVCKLLTKNFLLNVVIRFDIFIGTLFWIIKEGTSLSSLSMQDTLFHWICKEVSWLNFNAIFGLAAFLWNRRVFDILVSGHGIFLSVGHLLGWPKILLMTTQLCVAVFDKGTFARVEDCTLIICTVISNIA